MQPEKINLRKVVADTVTLLCKSSLTYSNQLKIEGVVGVTVDGCIFIVHIDEEFTKSSEVTTSLPATFESNEVHPVKSEQEENKQYNSQQLPHSRIKIEPPTRPQLIKNSAAYLKQESDNVQDNLSCSLSGSNTSKHSRNYVQLCSDEDDDNPNIISLIDNDDSYSEFGMKDNEGFLSSYATQQNINDDLNENIDENDMWSAGQSSYDRNGRLFKAKTRGNRTTSHNLAVNEKRINVWRSAQKRSRLVTGRQDGGSRKEQIPRGASFIGRDMVITESTHICGYIGCLKRFKFRHDLLRHQTKKHGRTPAFSRKRQKNVASNNEEEYYYDECSGFQETDDGYDDGCYA